MTGEPWKGEPACVWRVSRRGREKAEAGGGKLPVKPLLAGFAVAFLGEQELQGGTGSCRLRPVWFGCFIF